MDLFLSRDSIKDLPIYPVRGNHDCYFKDQEAEINLSKIYPTWKMPGHYYEKTFGFGSNGEKLSLLQVDSCYLLCGDPESQECEDLSFEAKARDQQQWLNEVLKRQSSDSSLIWKATSLHHPMFSLNRPDSRTLQGTFLK